MPVKAIALILYIHRMYLIPLIHRRTLREAIPYKSDSIKQFVPGHHYKVHSCAPPSIRWDLCG